MAYTKHDFKNGIVLDAKYMCEIDDGILNNEKAIGDNKKAIGDIETALDNILVIQNSLIGGDSV